MDNAQETLRELLADNQHAIWAHWMKYQFSQCHALDNGDVVIPAANALRWQRQMNTPYADLTEREKESDREQADKVIAVIDDAVLALDRFLAEE